MVEVFDTHKFLFTLNYDGEIKGLRVIFINKKNEEQEIVLDRIEITPSPISCSLISVEGEKYRVPFLKIKKIFRDKEMIWDNSDVDLSNYERIEGFK